MAARTTDYLIIGNSASGIAAVEQIREHAGDEASITMLSKEPYPAYGRPLISYLIEGKTSEDKIWLKPKGFYEDNGIDALFGPEYEAVSLESSSHTVKLANSDTITYGKCLLATGSIPFVPPIQGIRGSTNVYTFMTLDDAKGVWEAAEKLQEKSADSDHPLRIIVIGAGLIGLKAAESLSSYADEVLVLELAPRILPAVLDEEGASILQEKLAEHGIVCMPGISVEKMISDENGVIYEAVLTNGDIVACDIVVAAVGVRPNSALAVDDGAEQGRGLVCDASMQTSLEDVYAAGDVVQVTDLLDGTQHPLALWPHAVQQGRLAGLNMAGCSDVPSFDGGFAVNAVDFFDVSLLTSGVINPQDDPSYEQRVISNGASYAKFVIKDDKLFGYILLNRPDNAGIYTSMIENGVSLETMNPSVFEEAPQNLCFPDSHRWKRMHRGFPSDRTQFGWKKVL